MSKSQEFKNKNKSLCPTWSQLHFSTQLNCRPCAGQRNPAKLNAPPECATKCITRMSPPTQPSRCTDKAHST